MQEALCVFATLGMVLLCAGCLETAADWDQAGVTHHTMGRYEEAVAAFDKALSLDPQYAVAWRDRGLSLALLARANESEESFARAIALSPGDASVHYYQALARNATGNREGALQSLEKAVSIQPRSRDEGISLHGYLTYQGQLLTLDGRHEEANTSYRRAQEILMSTI
jgi:tetratricopeptide (TPR) repeat protein